MVEQQFLSEAVIRWISKTVSLFSPTVNFLSGSFLNRRNLWCCQLSYNSFMNSLLNFAQSENNGPDVFCVKSNSILGFRTSTCQQAHNKIKYSLSWSRKQREEFLNQIIKGVLISINLPLTRELLKQTSSQASWLVWNYDLPTYPLIKSKAIRVAENKID